MAMNCPQCGFEMDLKDTIFDAPYDQYWHCHLCNYSCNFDGTPTNWKAIIKNSLEKYYITCLGYKKLLDENIHIGMNSDEGTALIVKYVQDFKDDTREFKHRLERPLSWEKYARYNSSLNTAMGIMFSFFAKSCININNYKLAQIYIEPAVKFVHSRNEHYKEIFDLQSEILAHTSPIESSDQPADMVLSLPASARMGKPSQNGNSIKTDTPSPPEQSKSPKEQAPSISSNSSKTGCLSGCFLWVSGAVLIMIALSFLLNGLAWLFK